MSRSDERREPRAWDDGTPTFRERLTLAIRQNPARGVLIGFLFLLSFGFLVGALVEFRDPIREAIVGAVSALLAGEPIALLGGAVVFVAIGVAVLLLRRG